MAVVVTLGASVSLALFSWIPGYRSLFRGLPEIAWWIEDAFRPLIPVVLGLLFVYGARPARWARELGMSRPVAKALLLALLVTSPLVVVPQVLGAPLSSESWIDHLFGFAHMTNAALAGYDLAGQLANAVFVGIVFPAPSNDWEAITACHSRPHRMRAIENGFALLRPTSQGAIFGSLS